MTESQPEVIIYRDELVYAKHAYIPKGQETVYLGWLIAEPIRRVSGLGDLTDAEAQAMGLLVTRLSRALKSSEGAEHIYSFAIGHGAPHLHIHIIPRYPDTPREYWGINIDEWPDAPRGNLSDVEFLCARLRSYLHGNPHDQKKAKP